MRADCVKAGLDRNAPVEVQIEQISRLQDDEGGGGAHHRDTEDLAALEFGKQVHGAALSSAEAMWSKS